MLEKAHRKYGEFCISKEYRGMYEVREKWRHDQLSELQAVRQEAIEQTTRNLINMGLPVQQITRGTGLSVAEVEIKKIIAIETRL